MSAELEGLVSQLAQSNATLAAALVPGVEELPPPVALSGAATPAGAGGGSQRAGGGTP